jgi:hypothetical protein
MGLKPYMNPNTAGRDAHPKTDIPNTNAITGIPNQEFLVCHCFLFCAER